MEKENEGHRSANSWIAISLPVLAQVTSAPALSQSDSVMSSKARESGTSK
jgi:hypothetical protein